MPHTRMSTEEVGKRGQELYETRLRPLVETEENIGKLIVIDVETGEYEIDTDANSIMMTRRLLAKHDDPLLYQIRIGYDAVHAFGGFRLRPSKR